MPNQGACHRLGMAVSRKVSKKAVERNRIKRQVRESFRLFNSAPRPVSQSAPLFMDIVVVAKPSAASAGNDLIRTELDRVWSRAAGVLSDKERQQADAGTR